MRCLGLVWAATWAGLLGSSPAQFFPSQKWLSATVGSPPAKLALTQHSEHTSPSWTHCTVLAELLEWPQMVCYARPTCQLWAGFGVLQANVTKSGTVGGQCKVASYYTRCFRMDFSMARIGETGPNPTCPILSDVCEEGGFVAKQPVLKNTCDSPYELYDNVGCIHILTEMKTWCEGRRDCMQAEGDLYYVKTRQEFEGLRKYIASKTEYYGLKCWMGLWMQDGAWEWLHSNFTPAPQDWSVPPDSSHPVARFLIAAEPVLESAGIGEKTVSVCRRWM